MNLHFLDAGGAGLVFFAYGLIVLFIGIAILIEAVVMIVMKYNTRFKKTFLDSFLANIASLAVGFILQQFSRELFSYESFLNLAVLYVITVAIESGVLYLLNRTHPLNKTIVVSLAMNLVTYLILFLITSL